MATDEAERSTQSSSTLPDDICEQAISSVEVELGKAGPGLLQDHSSESSVFMNEGPADAKSSPDDGANDKIPEQERESDRIGSPTSSIGSGDNLRRRRRPKRYMWGGKLIKSIEENGGNFSLYSDDFAVEGLQHAFDSSNSFLRTSFWSAAFVAFGAFFLFLTIPMVLDYKDRMVVTSIDSEQGAEGLPLPVVTVCPRASGVRCDCLLWRKLHCRYRYIVRNLEWMSRFDEWQCYGDFDHFNLINGTYPTMTRENCNDFDFGGNFSLPFEPQRLVVDPCRVDQEFLEAFPLAMNMDALYERIVAREGSLVGPFITVREIILYAGESLGERVKFVDASAQEFPQEWVNYHHMEWGLLKICAQFRPPNGNPNAQQRVPGSQKGLSVMVHGIREGGFPLKDMLQSSPAVDVHINMNQGEEHGKNDIVTAPSHEFVGVAAGFHSTIGYETKVFKRYRGWGSDASRTCANTLEPRQVCFVRRNLERAGEQCGCKTHNSMISGNASKSPVKIGNWDSPDFFGCSITKNTPEWECVRDIIQKFANSSVGFSECPNQCETKKPRILTHSTKALSKGQLLSLTTKFRLSSFSLVAKETVLLNLGLATMDIETVTERPVTTFPELMGQIGGNLGLWCGLSFLTMVEVIEFLVIAIIYARGFYSNRGRNLKDHVNRIPPGGLHR